VSHLPRQLKVGVDIGSVSAKMVLLVSAADFMGVKESPLYQEALFCSQITDYFVLAFQPVKVLGQPLKAAAQLLKTLFDGKPSDYSVVIHMTGCNGKSISQQIPIPYMNEFMAISHGVIVLVPDARTILEIGGDGSRFIKIAPDDQIRVTLLDYERNGECAAGTGSFIDQQAARLHYKSEDIGSLVMAAERAAIIAGRCSVFAKSDMIHAQQRGYAPGAIFKGLCEAVVRNYKGTVLRGKDLLPTVVFVGGLAENKGVVQALHTILGLDETQLVVPELHLYAAALGCACNSGGTDVDSTVIDNLLLKMNLRQDHGLQSQLLSDTLVRIVQDKSLKSDWAGCILPIPVYLGIDVGSVSTNLVLLDEKGFVVDEVYTRTEGRPIDVVQRELLNWQRKWGHCVQVVGVGTTGSGRELVGKLVGADVVHDEITAHKTGAGFVARTLFDEKVQTIFEIGGQDSKFISIENDIVVDFTMNEACAAGTGSFLEEQAAKLGINIEKDFAELAMKSDNPVKMGERCTVFMEKDVAAFLQRGVGLENICAGLAFAVVQNYLNRVVRGRPIGDSIYFQGGTAYNKAVAAAFATVLKKKIIVPPHNGVMGAIGVALLAKVKMTSNPYISQFRGFDLSRIDYHIHQFTCHACSNQCDIQECTVQNEKSYWGDKCSERYRQKRKVNRKALIPNLMSVYEKLLMQDLPGSNGHRFKVGIPRSLYFYERFPFWKSYFTELGIEIVLSEPTNRQVIKRGQEACIAEPCFPIVISHGHILDLFEKKVDYIFSPIIVNTETHFQQNESWFCPWGQTLPLVIKNTFYQSNFVDKIVSPIIRFRDGLLSVQNALRSVARLFGVSIKTNDRAVETAYQIYNRFRLELKRIGIDVLKALEKHHQDGIVIIGRAYNIYDKGVNLNVPTQLYDEYGLNVIPLDFLPSEDEDISHIHNNMFWNYGRRILQAGQFVGRQKNLHVIYFTNFKCGPDSYIKHFIHDAIKAPFLILQFDDHSNDAGIITRCEAYLESNNLLQVRSDTTARHSHKITDRMSCP
jgi:predicted CoA-substrate-specific enzyme activase